MCGGDLDYDKVSKALIRMFGGDHKPSSRDLGRQSNPSAKEETYYEEEDEIWYEEAEDWVDDWYDDEEAFEVGEYDNDDDIPEELEEAMDHADEAYVSYVESRKRMKELALARGFYPVVALGPEAEKGAYRSFKGDGKGKGKGKNGNSKGKSKGKGKGGGFLRRAPFNRRPMSGLRKGPMTSTTTASSEKSTFSGSTQQHGPRFKRYRSQAQGVKEVPEEVTMVEEMMVEEKMDLEWLDSSMEQCFFASTEVGKAIVDSGATRTIVGENNWHLWLEKYDSINLKPVEVNQVTRQFKFGGGETLVSTYEVKFTAWVHGQALDITASVVPGSTPFLLARPVLEEWGVVHDYKNGAMKIGESPWFKPERNDRGHFLLDLMMYHKKPIQEETYYQFEEAENSCGVFTETQLIDGGPLDVWDIEPAMEFTATTEGECHEIFEVESIAEQAVRRLREKRILRFFEVYVDEGNLSVHLANQYEDVEVSGFSLPEWDLSEDEVRKEFINLLREVSPDFVWLAPPCRKWSAMQRLNLRSRAQKDKLQDDRLKEEQTHLALVKDTAAVTKENGNNYACEHPHGADSWKTETMKSMKGYYEAVCDRCRTGLRVDDGHDHGPVRKQTRIRTSSIKVAEAMHLPCECQVHHVQMEGKTKQLRGMQNYEEGFVKRAAKAIYECMDESWRKKEIAKIMATEVMVTEEMTKNQVKGDEKPETHPKKAWQVIDKLHRQLGHPGRDRLVVAVRDAELGEELVKVAKAYKCDVCQNFTNKKTAKPASLPQASSFNELLEMDVFHIKWNDEKRRILAIIDIYSRYEMNAVVASETEKEELGILDQWINAFGCPSKIRADASGAHMSEQPSKAEKMTEETSSRPLQPARGRSRSPQNRDERSVALSSYNLSRQLDGLPPVQATDPVFHRYMDTLEPLDDDEMLLAEHFNEKKLTPEQRKEFDNAKDAALQVWIENAAWKAVPEEEAKEGEVVPARFLQRWKPTADGHKANARVILQGFRHKDVLSENLVKESPTLSRFGRITLMVWAVHRRWKLWCADVKSAFMQANSIDDTTRIYVKPPAEMRRRLERLMGLKSHEILKATKPAFGDVRAPRQWHETANDYLVNELGLVNHPLDRCLYLSLRPAVQEDPNFLVFESKGGYWIVDGALGLHVDDFLGAGEGVYSLKDVKTDAAGACDIFQNRVNLLSQRFRFGAWDFGDKMRFCGAEVQQSPELEVISVSLKEYVHKIKPLSMEKMRKNMQDDYCTEKEHRMLRALVGAMSWPVTQCLPQAAATISILQANINKPMVKDMLDANKCLRFMKEVVKDYTFTIRSHGDIENIRIGVYCDAAWSVRPDGSSQGGMLMFLASHDELQGETPFPLTVIDWSSKKLVRMCRSSLAAEAQSATIAVDELGWAKVFFAATVNPYVPIQLDETMHLFKESPVITDAKALYDSAGSVTPGLKLSERRTAIEISILRERMKAALGQFRWVNSLQQLADGLTKPSAKDALAHTLARGVHALKYDPNFVAAKKVSGETKEQENLEYEKAAAELFDGQVFYVDKTELKESRQLCMLPGCQKQRDMSTEGNRYCSRRHFYTHRFRQGGGGDEWQKAAKCALAILASEATVVEATNGTNHDDEGRPLTNTAMVIVLFALVGMICSSQLLKEVLHLLAIKVYRFFHPDDEAEFGYEEEPRLETSHGEIVNAARHGVREYDIAPESEEMEVDEEDEPEIVRCGPMAKERWMRLYEEVRAEAGQQNWRWTNEILWTDAVSSQMRGHVLSHVVPEKRREEYLKLVVKKDCMQVSDDEIRQWHRFLNGHFNLIVETHVEVRELRQKKAKELKDQEEDPHEVERRKFREGLLRDRQQQTYATYNHVTNEMRHTQRNGAWEHVSCYEGRV
eukprot:g16596.t1